MTGKVTAVARCSSSLPARERLGNWQKAQWSQGATVTYLPAGDSVARQVQTVADVGGSRVHLRETGYFGPSPNGQQAQQGRTGGAESPNSRQVQQGRTGATPGDWKVSRCNG